MSATLLARKQDLMRDAIFDAAINLFAMKGFDETTLEDVSRAAGMSPRTLYRYFATRDELLAHGVVDYGRKLISAVKECPAKTPPIETIRHAALVAMEFTMGLPRIKEIIKISATHPSVRQAQQAGMVAIHTQLAAAFASRLKNESADDLLPRMYASMTVTVVEGSIPLWFKGEYKDATSAVNKVLAQLALLFCGRS